MICISFVHLIYNEGFARPSVRLNYGEIQISMSESTRREGGVNFLSEQ